MDPQPMLRVIGDNMWFVMVLLIAIFIFSPTTAHAQPANMFTVEPRCVTLINQSGGEVVGHVETALYTDPKGKNHWFRKNFKLAEGAQEQACSTGPFFPGFKIRVVVKSLFPLYTCLVAVPRTVTITRNTGDQLFDNSLKMDCPQEQAAASS